jgi:hypothetical protein
MERDSRRIAREWNREIEAEIRRLAARRDEGWGRLVVWTVFELVWLVAVFVVLGVFSRLHCRRVRPPPSFELPASLISLIIQRKYSQELARDRGKSRVFRRPEAE